MKAELAHNVVALAHIFGLKITNWVEINNSINFYHNDVFVGSISLEKSEYTDEFNFTIGHAFTLYPSIGQIKGVYEPVRDAFFYSFARVNYNQTDYNNTHGFASNLLANDKKIGIYRDNSHSRISSEVKMTNTSIEIRRRTTEGIWDIFECALNNLQEMETASRIKPITIEFNYIKSGKGKVFSEAKMYIEEEIESKSFTITFKFLKEKYTTKVNYNGITSIGKLQSLYFATLIEEIKSKCPDFAALIDKVKEELSFPYFGDKSISLYDNIANMCLDDPAFALSLASPAAPTPGNTARFVLKF